jgi:thiamine biosynthesis lipoprotein
MPTDKNILQKAFRFSHSAMGTVFEIFIDEHDRRYACQAADEAFRLCDALEQVLSHFIANSDVSRISALHKNESTKVSPETFACLEHCKHLYAMTAGVFDVTIGSLMNVWLNEDKTLRRPAASELVKARQRTGMDLLELDQSGFTVKVLSDNLAIDLGGYGKGYAVDRMAESLREWSISRFLIHGGKSSLLASDPPAEADGWPIYLTDPDDSTNLIKELVLVNNAVGASGLLKGFHIIDPRTAQPVLRQRAVWVFATDAALADALSTAFMIFSEDEIGDFCGRFPNVRALVVRGDKGDEASRILYFGETRNEEH